MPEAKVVDVTPRDGLQNEPKPVSTEEKLVLIEKLVRAGVSAIQATSFVHPRWVPQMADAEAVAAGLKRFPGVRFSALVPNLKGYERAVVAGFTHLEFVMSASESFNRRNLNCGIADSLRVLNQVSRAAERDGVALRVGFATSFHCPFEGKISTGALVDVARAAREHGPWRLNLSDTDGMAFPDQVKEAVATLREKLNVRPGELALASASSTPPPAGSADARIVLEPVAIWPPRTWWRYSRVWDTKPELIWRNSWTPLSLPLAFRRDPIRGICSELGVRGVSRPDPAPAVWNRSVNRIVRPEKLKRH